MKSKCDSQGDSHPFRITERNVIFRFKRPQIVSIHQNRNLDPDSIFSVSYMYKREKKIESTHHKVMVKN